MAVLGRICLLMERRNIASADLNPSAGVTETDELLAKFTCREATKVITTLDYNSSGVDNVGDFRLKHTFYRRDATEISTDTENLPINVAGSITKELDVPAETHYFKIVAELDGGVDGASGSTSNGVTRAQIGVAKGVTIDGARDLIKEYILGSDKPKILESGNQTFTLAIELAYIDSLWATKVLDGTKVDIAAAPKGWATGNPLIIVKRARLNAWTKEIVQDGIIAESLEGEGDDLDLLTI